MIEERYLKDKIIGSLDLNRKIFSKSNPFISTASCRELGVDDIKGAVKRRHSYQPLKQNTHVAQEASAHNLASANREGLLMIGDGDGDGDNNGTQPQPTASSAVVVKSIVNPSQDTSQKRMSDLIIHKKHTERVPTPQWHANWELAAVISGHLGWVRVIAFDPSNEWFVTGSADRTIKVWDLAKCCAGVEGGLKLTLTGHISPVRGLAVSDRHPYLFSAGEDKAVKCWDLEYNKVIRHYHGHLSGVYSLALHPTLDLLITGGRDSVARVWDIRSKHQIHVLGGHTNTVGTLLTSSVDPQVVTGSHDSTIKLWDLAAGKTITTLTQHKKAVRHLSANPKEASFVSCGADNIKKWQTRDGRFLKNFSGHNSVVNCSAINEDGVMVTCGDNGTMCFWDYDTGYCFQQAKTLAQPGSLDAEVGIFAASFDLSGSRLLTCEADKSIKIWKENENSTEFTHPVDMEGWTKDCLKLKHY